MTKLVTKAVLAALALGVSAPAFAQAAAPAAPASTGPVVPGVGVINLEAVIANSAAYKAAQIQRNATYKAQIDQTEARAKQIQDQLDPLVAKFNADRAAAGANQQALQTQAQQIQQIQQSGEAEIQKLQEPLRLSEAYIVEQIQEKLGGAVRTAMTKNKISLLLRPESVVMIGAPGYDISQAVVTELNAVLPSVQVTPPAGWQPREQREQAAAARPAPAPASSSKAPSGR